MTVESASYIDGLNSAYPGATDVASEGDDHIRLIKQVLKATFPNITGAVAATDAEMSTGIPIGCILLWSGSIATIPTNYCLCNGQTVVRTDGGGNITAPDLTGRFVVHADADAAGTVNKGATGGTAFASLSAVTSSSAGGHTPTGTTAAGGDHDHGGATAAHTLTIDEMPSHGHAWQRLDHYQTGIAGGNSTGSFGLGQSSSASVTVSAQDNNPTPSEAVNDQLASRGGSQAHSHNITTSGTHTHTLTMDAVAAHSHTVDVTPPYYALAYIMRY